MNRPFFVKFHAILTLRRKNAFTVRSYKYLHKLQLDHTFTSDSNCSKIYNLIKNTRFLKEISLENAQNNTLRRILPKIIAKVQNTCSKISLPETISFRTLINCKNIRTYPNKTHQYYGYNKVYHRKLSELHFYIKGETNLEDLYENRISTLMRLKYIEEISINTKWTVDALGMIRKIMKSFSEYQDLKRTYLKIEEQDMCLYLHSFHALNFWNRLYSFNLIVDTIDSLKGLLEYAPKLPNLSTLMISTGKKFQENAFKKGEYDTKFTEKFQTFSGLKNLNLSLNIKELVKSAIDFFKCVKFPSTLESLFLELFIPDMDTIIQKATSSLSLTTYLSVENQPPFKEFISNMSNLVNISTFKATVHTKQMQAPHAKLFPAIMKSMKELSDFELNIVSQQAKPLRYLAFYNSFSKPEKVQSIRMSIEPSSFELAGCEMLELDNGLTNLKEISLTALNETLSGDNLEVFFKSIASKNMEIIKLNFIQAVDDKKLEKRFSLLAKCLRLRQLSLKFTVSDISDISLEEMRKCLGKMPYLSELSVNFIQSGVGSSDLSLFMPLLKNKKNLIFGLIAGDDLALVRLKSEPLPQLRKLSDWITIDDFKVKTA